jgi:N-acetyl-gamma-glutamyl-phosphate reductase
VAATLEAGRLRVGVLGASGYGGAGLIERLSRHPHVELVALGSRNYLGKPLADAWPHLAGTGSPLRFVDTDEVLALSDVVFCATPHAATAPIVARAVAAGKRVVDLSADFRLGAADYERWYGGPHPHPELLGSAVYGLVELHRHELPGATIVASPGCNATAASLALAPLAASGLLGDSVVVNVLAGVSGAGRATSPALHFSEMNENARPYKPSGTHRHTAEIEAVGGRAVAAAARGDGKRLVTHARYDAVPVSFMPHIVPLTRGILATVSTRPRGWGALEPSTGALLELVSTYYAGDPLIGVSPTLPETKAVSGSDRAQLSAHYDDRTGHALVFCAIDNLGKGASGQAVQGFNVAFGFEETTALSLAGVWP